MFFHSFPISSNSFPIISPYFLIVSPSFSSSFSFFFAARRRQGADLCLGEVLGHGTLEGHAACAQSWEARRDGLTTFHGLIDIPFPLIRLYCWTTLTSSRYKYLHSFLKSIGCSYGLVLQYYYQWIGWRENLNWKPPIFPLNMRLTCKISQVPTFAQFRITMEHPHFEEENQLMAILNSYVTNYQRVMASHFWVNSDLM
jgi:hypothetical protein